MGLFGRKSKLERLIEDIKKRWPDLFVESDDVIWKEWHKLIRRDSVDMFLEILKGDFSVRFKARAVLALLAPQPAKKIKDWHLVKSISSVYGFDLGLLKEQVLKDYAASLIMDFLRLAKQEGSNVADPETQAAIYNDLLVPFMVAMPERAGEFLEIFSLNDVHSWSDIDDSSGYNPFGTLLWSHAPEEIKRRADAMMRSIVLAELDGKAIPRAKHENASGCYAQRIGCAMLANPQPYSQDLLVDQIRFLLSLMGRVEHNLFESYNFWRISALLSTPGLEQLHKEFVNFAVLVFREFGEAPFAIYDQPRMDLVQAWKRQYQEEQATTLSIGMDRMIALGEARIAQDRQGEQAHVAVQNTVLSKMK